MARTVAVPAGSLAELADAMADCLVKTGGGNPRMGDAAYARATAFIQLTSRPRNWHSFFVHRQAQLPISAA